MNDYIEFLDVKVIQEGKPVTYKSLARSLGIHVNTAKQALYEFSTKHENVFAVYCVTGIAVQNDQFKIQLVKETELEDAKKNYKQLTGVHVYSVTSFNPNNFSIFYTAHEDAPKLSIEDRVKCGVLKNVNVKVKEAAHSRRTDISAVKTPVKPSSVSSSKPSIPKPTISTPATPKTKPDKLKRKGTLNFGPATTKKQATETETKTSHPTPKPVVTNLEKKETEHAARMAKTSIKASDIFSDDDEEEPEPQPVEDLKNEDDDIEMEDTEEPEQTNQETIDKETKEEPSTLKSRKKVLKKKTTRNARGFLVTEEVWEFESGDEEESAPTAAVKKNTSSSSSGSVKKKTVDKKPTKQANLFSFFQKK